MVDLEKIKSELLSRKNCHKTIEEILAKYNWKNFEEFVAEIFEKNDFKTRKNFRFKTKERFEIDVVAVRNNFIFCIDCKSWSSGRYKKSSLKKAVKEQKRRAKEFDIFLKKNFIAMNLLHVSKKRKIYPLIVTLFEEELLEEEGMLIVPVWKLNSFLNNFENYF